MSARLNPKPAMAAADGIGRPNALHGHPVQGYSRFVIWMKVLLPVVALLLIVLIVVWPYLKLNDTRFNIGFTALKVGNVEDPAMINPRFLGADKERQTFSITADIAKNLLNAEKSVELEMPKADISLDDGSWLVVTAKNGIYARQNETLTLNEQVNLFHDSGYEFRTESADIELTSGIASGSVPIEGQGPFGKLQAEGFRLVDKGKTIYFTGKSKLTIYPGAGEQQQ
ncbi:MAG: LPS export ABC transporter periplasmic protein LptC [Rhodospirillaceae bacterium]|nr:LPS export ABC transporter periplasmic protein LptC [Rhodospirillaceae bacterium]MBL6930819.1 LPS export ABC transporter periplasmic protein LptC [Rhodospirillales bacterium]MBL6941316.1 LPS export ABC transporter periplasmic protein LptC [Rhodospirillales bacterium]